MEAHYPPVIVPPDTDVRLVRAMWQLSVPEHMRSSLLRYVVHGLPPGSFLEAVLSNDLCGACLHADNGNREALYAYAAFLYNYAPEECWGSPERYEAWIRRGEDARAAMQSGVGL